MTTDDSVSSYRDLVCANLETMKYNFIIFTLYIIITNFSANLPWFI